MQMFDEQVVTKFVSDEETVRDMVKELDCGKPRQSSRTSLPAWCNPQTADPQLCRESEAANKRPFALFEQGWTAGDKLLFKAYWAYKARLCSHHRWES